MKKIFVTLIGLLASLEMLAQLGYHYEDKFIQLMPSMENRYFVQARNSESKEYLDKMANEKNRQGIGSLAKPCVERLV